MIIDKLLIKEIFRILKLGKLASKFGRQTFLTSLIWRELRKSFKYNGKKYLLDFVVDHMIPKYVDLS